VSAAESIGKTMKRLKELELKRAKEASQQQVQRVQDGAVKEVCGKVYQVRTALLFIKSQPRLLIFSSTGERMD